MCVQERKKARHFRRSAELLQRVALAERRNRLLHSRFVRSVARISKGFRCVGVRV
jgi:hypothetical protein